MGSGKSKIEETINIGSSSSSSSNASNATQEMDARSEIFSIVIICILTYCAIELFKNVAQRLFKNYVSKQVKVITIKDQISRNPSNV